MTWEEQRDREYAVLADLRNPDLTIDAVVTRNKSSKGYVYRLMKKHHIYIRKAGRPAKKATLTYGAETN